MIFLQDLGQMSPSWWELSVPPDPAMPPATPVELGPPHLCSHNSSIAGMSPFLYFLFRNNFKLTEKLQKEAKISLYTSVSQPFPHYCPPSPPKKPLFRHCFSIIAFCCELSTHVYTIYLLMDSMHIWTLHGKESKILFFFLPQRIIFISLSAILPHRECVLYSLYPDSPNANVFPYLLYHFFLPKCVFMWYTQYEEKIGLQLLIWQIIQ